MNCFVCGSEMKDYFRLKMLPEMPEWDYVRCENCGLVLCQTVYEMTSDEWQTVNDGHRSKLGADEDPDDPNWVSRLRCQAKLLTDLVVSGVWRPDAHIVDYGCGDGKLADYVQNELSVHKWGTCAPKLLKYDKYMRPDGPSDYLEDTDMKREVLMPLSLVLFLNTCLDGPMWMRS